MFSIKILIKQKIVCFRDYLGNYFDHIIYFYDEKFVKLDSLESKSKILKIFFIRCYIIDFL